MDREFIYECIPDASRELYGKTKDEQINNYYNANPEIFGEQDTSDPEEPLDYMVLVLTRELGQANLAYKGGYILNKRIPNCRHTKDIDFSIAQKEFYDSVKTVLKSLADKFISEGIAGSYTLKEEIADTSSGGIQFYGSNGERTVGVDVGLHSLSYGITSLSLSFGTVNVYSIERSLTDKLFVICSSKRFRRVKDLYDTYMMIKLYNIDYHILKECLTYREVEWELFPNDEVVITQLKYAYDKLDISIQSKMSAYEKPEFSALLTRLSAFSIPLISNEENMTAWLCEEGRWI